MAKQKTAKKGGSPLRRNTTPMLVMFLTPAVLLYLIVFLYPTMRTFIMSFCKVEGVTDPVSTWQFSGFTNYVKSFNNNMFQTAMMNLGRLWLVGGIAVMALALVFAVALTNGMKGKKFFRSVIYLPNLVSAVAMGTMWLYYALSKESYGLLNTIIGWFGGSNVMWTDPHHKFWSMLIAYCFGMVGYHMLIFASGIERISEDYYEAATLDGANKLGQFRYITLPLLKGVFKTNITMWSVTSVGFFVWSQLFSSVTADNQTITPMVYLYMQIFGAGNSVTERNSGLGAAVGVMLSVCVVLIFWLCNHLLKDDDLEF